MTTRSVDLTPTTASASRSLKFLGCVMAAAWLSVAGPLWAQPPELPTVTPPTPQLATNCPGTTASFSVTATNADWFFWYFAPLDLSSTNLVDHGETLSTLTLTNVQPVNSGYYAVVVTNVSGAATSWPPAVLVVGDFQPPVISGCPANITQPAAPGVCNAVVTWPAPTADDNCDGAVAVTCVPPSGSTFPVGVSTVVCSAVDSAGNSNACVFTVSIQDTQPPVIGPCPDNIVDSTPPGACSRVVTWSVPSATDNCPGVSVVCSPASGSSFPKGTTTVTCTATDAGGNTSACSFLVTISDTVIPSITCPSDITVASPSNCQAVVTFAPSVSDNCPGVTWVCTPPSGSTFSAGTTVVNCVATDASENQNFCSFNVTVTVSAPAITTQPADRRIPMGNGTFFTVAASGTPPLSYQWQTNGVNVPGATGTTFAISNLALAWDGMKVRAIVSNCAGTTPSAEATLTVTPVGGISFDFDTPGQFTNAPYNVFYNDWLNNSFNTPNTVYESPIGGIGPFPGSGCLDLIRNNGTDNTMILLPSLFDFSLPGKVLMAQTTFKVKNPTSNTRMTQLGFLSYTNFGHNDNTPQSFMTVILQSTAQPSPTYELRHQRRTSGGGLMESIYPGSAVLTVSNWYRLTAIFTNTRHLAPSNYSVVGILEDLGPLGTSTPTTVLSFFTPTNHSDITFMTNVFLGVRGHENAGVEVRDTTWACSTPGPVFMVTRPADQTVLQGRRAIFRAIADGTGPYRYQWQRSDDGGSTWVDIPGARNWKYMLVTRTSDHGAQFRVVVTGPTNSVTSDPATLTVVSDPLTVVGAGSVDGTTVGVEFNQPVDPATAENPANYSINGSPALGARVFRTGLGPMGLDGIYVILTPAERLTGPFSLTVSGVTSLSGDSVVPYSGSSLYFAGLTPVNINPEVTAPPGEEYCFGPGKFIITGGGADIWGVADQTKYLYTLRTGDFDVKMKVPYQDVTRSPSKAGFHVRNSLDPFDKVVSALVNPMWPGRNYPEGSTRQTNNLASTSWGANPTYGNAWYPNTWLRFRRCGNVFLRYSSTNGINWTLDGQTSAGAAAWTWMVPETVYFGIAVCAVANWNPHSAQIEEFGDFAGYTGATITISRQPTNAVSIAAGSSAVNNLVATVSGGGIPALGELCCLWQRYDPVSASWTNLVMAGATNQTVTIGPLYITDNGAQFRCVLRAPGASEVISDPFTITVTDTTAPTIASAGVGLPGPGMFPFYPVNEVVVTFSEPVSAATALVPGNYTITNAGGPMTVTSASFHSGDPRAVLLTVTPNAAASTSTYWGVVISGVTDLAGNTIAANSVASFRAFPPPAGPVVVELYQDTGSGTTMGDLTNHATFRLRMPTFIVYSNWFGCNVKEGMGSIQDNYGARAYTYFVPPSNGFYKFWVRVDDVGELWMNTNGHLVRWVTPSSYSSPAAENAEMAVDGTSATKYLNFDKLNTGFTITLANGPRVVRALRFTTANDAPERDPMNYRLEGSNGDQHTGPWTLIAEGSTGLEVNPGRLVRGAIIPVGNTTPYLHYRITFPTVRSPAAANSMQIAEVEFLDSATEPAVNLALDLGKIRIGSQPGATAAYVVPTDSTAAGLTNIWLFAGRRYYMEFLMKEGGGGDGFSVMWTAPAVVTAPSQTTYIPMANLEYPAFAAPEVRVITEWYTAQTGPGTTGIGTLPGLIFATNYPTTTYDREARKFKFIASTPDVVGYQKYFGTQPLMANTRYDSYIGRMISYFVPPSNGLYKFWIRCDDACQLWMNTNAVDSMNPAGAVLLEQQASWNAAYVTVPTKNVWLIGGQRYYIEGRWTEGSGGDGMTVQVKAAADGTTPQGNTSTFCEIIPASMLAFPLDRSRSGPVNLRGIAPANPVVREGEQLILCADGLSGAAPYGGFIWLKDGVVVLANSFTNITPPLTLADNGSVYTLIVTNQFSRIERSTTVTVLPDTTGPTVVRCVGWPYGDGFTIEYSEPVEALSATYLGNYQVAGLRLLSARLDRTRRMVAITTSPQAPDTTYTVLINGVRDASAAGNLIAPNTTASFSTWVIGGKGILVQLFTNISGTAIFNLTDTDKFRNNLPDVVYYTNVFGVGAFGADSGLDMYGARIIGYFIPTNTGYYRFYVRADDASQLWMNIDPDPARSMDPAGRIMLIDIDGANVNIQTPRAISVPVWMNAGQRYYMEGLVKEGGGGDYFQMTFRPVNADGHVVDYPIPADGSAAENTSVAFFDGAPGNPDAIQIVSAPPEHLYVTENDYVTIALVANMPLDIRRAALLQWQSSRDGGVTFTNIPGATGLSISFTAKLPDDLAQFRLDASFPGLVRQYTTVLHVAPDENPPEILSCNSLDGKSLVIRYKRTVDAASATDPVNYDLNYTGFMDAVGNGVMVDDRTVLFQLAETSYLTEEWFHIDGYSISSGAQTPVAGDVSGDGHVEFLTPLDIGNPGVDPAYTGSSFTWTNSYLTLKGGGSDIWGTFDAMHYAYRPVLGNFDVRVRVESLVSGATWSKAGIMVRSSTASNARWIMLCVTPPATQVPAGQNRYAFQWRDNDGLSASWAAEAVIAPPYPNAWVRLQRRGSVINAYWSSNGTDWLFYASRDTAAFAGGPYPDTMLVGLVAGAVNNVPANFATAEFRDLYFPLAPRIQVQPGPTPQVVGIHQTVTFSGLVATGAPPITYQWHKDGLPIPGATNAWLTITDTMVADSGTYTVLVANDGGGTLSAECVLVVTNLPPVTVGETNVVVQGNWLTVSTAELLANDWDPEGDPVSIIAVSGVPPVTWSANFDDGQVPSGATIYGSAGGGYIATTDGVNGTGCLKLTDNVNSQAGSLILPELTPGKRVSAFTASFKLRIGNGSAEPADGFSFNFANDLPLSATTPCAAENGAGTGLSFCVDNYRFVPLNVGGPACSPGGGTANTSGLKVNYNNQIIAGVRIPTWNVARWVPVTITLTPEGVLTVYVDGTNVFGNLVLPGYTPKPGRFGLYARTGGQNQTHWVDDLSVTVLTADTARDYALGGRLYGTAYIFPTGGVGNSGKLHLTDNVNNQMGALILDSLTPGSAVASFQASFRLRIGDGSGNAADGFSFNLAADLPEPPPYAAYEEGAGTGLSVCVDNYPTGGTDAPSVKLKYGGALLGYILIPKWNSPAWVPINITLAPGGVLTVNVDGTNVVANLPIPGYTPIAGRFGLYARTGGENQTHWVDDLVITAWSTEGYPGYYAQDFNSGGPGSVSLSGGVVTYVPPPNACGPDVFYYIVSDGQVGGTTRAEKVVVINEAVPAPPTIVTCAPDLVLQADANCQAVVPDVTKAVQATDNCCCLTITQSPAAGTPISLSSTPVTITVTDAMGLSATCTVSIVVVDLTAPTITCPPNLTVNTDPGLCTANPAYSPTATDNCSVASVVCLPAGPYPVGSTLVTCTATDGSGNTAQCSFTITVLDAEPPVITCPADLSAVPVDAGQCYATGVSLGAPTVADNCAVASVVNNAPAQFPLGTTVVTWTVTDVNGNISTCQQQVTVVELIELATQHQGTNVVISWPKPCLSWQLEQTDELPVAGPATWTPVTEPPVEVDGQLQVTLPIGSGTKFFRLRKQP